MNNVEDMTQYIPRGGWITMIVPMLFNINNVARLEKKYFTFSGDEEPAYILHITFKHGDTIELIYAEEAVRNEDYEILTKELRRSKIKLVDGKPESKTSKQD